nr:hypothetical protein [Tanacetum cinerariifolium]
NSSNDEDVDDYTKGSDDKEGEKTDESDDDDDQDKAKKVNDDDDDEEEISKINEQEATERGEGDDEEAESDGESEEGETREQEEEIFDPILRTLKEGEDDGNGEEDQGPRISEEERRPLRTFQEKEGKDTRINLLRFCRHIYKIDYMVCTNFLLYRTMATTIEQQVALDEALVPSAQRNVDYAFLIAEDFVYQVEHKNQKKSNEMYYLRFTKVIFHHFITKKPSIPRRIKVNWNYVRDDILFSTIKVVSRHQNTQQYGAILHIELTTEDIRNTKAYKEYYACATGEAAPKPKASARRKRGGFDSSTTPPTPIATPTPLAALRLTAAAKGKQPARATSPTEPSDIERTEAEQLKIVLRSSRHETHISQQGGSSTDEGTGSIPGVPDVPSDDSEEEISWNSFDDEDVDDQTKGRDDNEGEKTDESDDDDDNQEEAEKVNDDDDDEEDISKIDEQEAIESGEGDDEETESNGESEEEETREKEEESFDPIPITPEENELYRDIDINQGRGLQVSQDIDDSHVTLTPIHSDGRESSSTSSFMTSLLNSIIDPGMESIFTTGSSSVTPIPSPKSTMTPSIITTTTTASQQPTPPTSIPSDVLQTLPTFTSVFRFEDRVKSLEVNFLDFMRTNQSPEAVSKILYKQRNLYMALVEAYDADKTILDSYGESAILKRRREDDNDHEGPSAGSDRWSKSQREGGEHASASTPSEPATTSAGRSTTGTQSRQMSASESAFAEEPMQNTCQMEEPSHPVFETAGQGNAQSWISALAKQTDARSSFNELLNTPIDFSNFIINRLGVDTLTPELLAGPTYELMRGSCNSLTELEYHLEEVYKATTDQLDWVNPEGQQYPHNLLQPLPLIPNNQGRRVIPFEHFINNDLEYLRRGASSQKYTTYVTKTKAADYEHIKWIEDLVPHLVPRTMWIHEPINYDKHALWGVSHWGWKRQQFYGFAVHRESALDV